MGSPNRQALKRVVYHFGGREKRRVRDACKNGQMQSVVPRILVCQQVATEFIGLIRSDLSGCFRISPAVPVLSSSGTRNWNLEVAAAVIACFLGMHRGVELGPAARQVLTLSSTALAGAACPCLPIVLRSNITLLNVRCMDSFPLAQMTMITRHMTDADVKGNTCTVQPKTASTLQSTVCLADFAVCHARQIEAPPYPGKQTKPNHTILNTKRVLMRYYGLRTLLLSISLARWRTAPCRSFGALFLTL